MRIERVATAAEAAKRFGVGRASISAWVNEHKAPHRREGRRYFFDLAELALWLEERQLAKGHGGKRIKRSAPGGKQGGDQGDDGGAETIDTRIKRVELRKKLAEAEIKELERDQRRGKVVPIEDVKQAQQDRVAYARAVLDGGPATLAPDLEGLDVAEIEARLAAWVRRVLSELAGG